MSNILQQSAVRCTVHCLSCHDEIVGTTVSGLPVIFDSDTDKIVAIFTMRDRRIGYIHKSCLESELEVQ